MAGLERVFGSWESGTIFLCVNSFLSDLGFQRNCAKS